MNEELMDGKENKKDTVTKEEVFKNLMVKVLKEPGSWKKELTKTYSQMEREAELLKQENDKRNEEEPLLKEEETALPGTAEEESITEQERDEESEVRTNHAVAPFQRAAELNSYMTMRHETGQLTEEVIKEHGEVVLTNSSLEEQLKVNDWCRSASPVVGMFVAGARGHYAQIFTDLGPKFTVVGTTGENLVTAMVTPSTKKKSGVVTTLDEARHGLEDGDVVSFSEIRRMEEINTREFPVKHK